MSSQNTTTGGKKTEILSAALELFLENGYEKTSVRMIAQKIGCEVGLIYYYFETKEDVFENALSLYYAQTETELQKLTDTQALVDDLAVYLENKAKQFRNEFANMHFTVRAAICEKITSLTEAYLIEMLEKAEKKNVTAISAFIASGLCHTIFAEDTDLYETNKESILLTAKKLIVDEKESGGKKRDIPSFLL